MRRYSPIPGNHICGCYYTTEAGNTLKRIYLPQVKLDAHTTVFSTASSTVLTQTFVNPSKQKPLGEIRYTFPLYDGASVVDFKCQVGERTIYGLVKEKAEARKTYEEAKERGEQAGLLEQLPNAADVFTTSISSVPEDSEVVVAITYIQELKHDAEVDGIRFQMPTSIAPRYGSYPGELMEASAVNDMRGMSITVDVSMSDGVPIKKITSPSHPIEMSLGTLSTSTIDQDPSTSKASATLALGTAELEKDFVLQVVARDIGVPQAILEDHPTLHNRRALMTTLVPKFTLKPQKPEIIFIADRSGSMSGNIPTLISALQVFLKSLPVGVTFNICSFGSTHKFLWPKSKLYSKDSLAEALKYVKTFGADFGGTETFAAVKASIENIHKDVPAEIMLLTDGDIWSQDQLFQYLETQTTENQIRVFPIGIGGGVSSALIEGVARAGRGFPQMVGNGEKLDGKIVRMLKGALTPHINDYTLEVRYEDSSVDRVADSLRLHLKIEEKKEKRPDEASKDIQDLPTGAHATRSKKISLFNPDAKDPEPTPGDNAPQDPFEGLPQFDQPKILQTPHVIPPLFPFNRTCVCLLLSPEASELQPKAVVLKGTSPDGPLELEIPVQIRDEPGEMIHQLAARKAIQELEEGRGWLAEAKVDGAPLRTKHASKFEAILQREAVRLGVEFQVGGKHCSFVAVEANEAEIAKKREKALRKVDKAYEVIEDDFEMVEHTDSRDDPSQRPEAIGGTTSGGRGWYGGRGLAKGGAMRHRKILPARSSTGGKAPRKQLASKAARKSAPASPPKPRASRRSKRKANQKVDSDDDDSDGGAPAASASLAGDASAEVDEEDSDEDMGFGLFDGEHSPPAPSAASGVSPESLPDMKRRKKNKRRQGARARLDLEAELDRDSDVEEEEEDKGTLLQKLINRQEFDGFWSRDKLPCDAMSVDREAAGAAVKKLMGVESIEGDEEKVGAMLATALIVLFLERKMAEEEETWELVVGKAKDWLDENVGGGAIENVWKEAGALVGKA